MKRRIIRIMVFILVTLMLFTPLTVFAEDVYTITFDRGYDFKNTLPGNDNHLFTGKINAPIKVNKGESFTFPEITIVFHDYVFVCWEYKYKNEEGKNVTEKYEPGDVYENVTSDMEISAVWTRPENIPIIITGYVVYDKGSSDCIGRMENQKAVFGTDVKLAKCTYTRDGFKFRGWSDSDGNVYADEATIKTARINTILTAVWQRDDSELKHTISFVSGNDEATGEAPASIGIYEKTKFSAPENTFRRRGYQFKYWVDTAGNTYDSGKEYSIPKSESIDIVLTAVWEEKETAWCNVTVNVIGDGSVDVRPGKQLRYEQGEDVTITITPSDEITKVKAIKVDGKEIDADTVIKLLSIQKDVIVEVEIEIIVFYEVNITSVTGGTSDKSGKIKVESGSEITITFTADNGYKLKAVSVNNKPVTIADNKIVLKNVSEDLIVVPIFAEQQEETSEESAEEQSEESSNVPDEESLPEPVSNEQSEYTSDDSENDSKQEQSDTNEQGIDAITTRYILILVAFALLMILGAVIIKLKR